MTTRDLRLSDDEARTCYAALVMAHECITAGMKEPEVLAQYSMPELAEMEEKAFKIADLLERFKGFAP